MDLGISRLSFLEWWTLLGNIALVFGFPLAILTFMWEARRAQQNERAEIQQKQEEIYQALSDAYVNFLKLLLDHPDLRMLNPNPAITFTVDQQEQRLLLFGILVSLFERAYILVYEDQMDAETKRRWQSWEDYIREWCRRSDFRAALAYHIKGEDPDFVRHIERILAEETAPSA
jgi:hypothetical protein